MLEWVLMNEGKPMRTQTRIGKLPTKFTAKILTTAISKTTEQFSADW